MEGSRSAARTELEHQVKRLHALVDAARRAAGHAHGLKPGVDAVQGESRSRMDAPVMLSAVTPHLLTFGSSFGREVCQRNRSKESNEYSDCASSSSGSRLCMLCITGQW